MKFSRNQVEFFAKWVLAAAFDRIESNLPDTISHLLYQQNKSHINSMIATAMDTAAMALAIFFAQSTGEGMGVWDWAGSNEFQAAVDDFVALRTNPEWKGTKVGEPCYPDTEPFAKLFAQEWEDAYCV